MNASPSGPWSVPTPSPAAQPPPGTKRVSSAGYWISGAILIIGTVGAVIWFITSIVGMFSVVDDYERVSVPGTLTTELEAGTFKLFDEFPGATNSFRAPPDVQITGPSGEAVRVRTSSVSQTYNYSDHEGRSFGEFDADRAGSYRFVVRGEPRATSSLHSVAIGKGYDLASFGGVIGSIALGGVSLLVGLTILVVTIIRRSRNRRANRPPTPRYPSGGYGGYGAPAGAMPGGYPPPTSPPSTYPPSPYPPGVPLPPASPPSWPPPSPPPGPPVAPPPAPDPPDQGSPPPSTPRSPWDPPGSGDPPPPS